MADRIVKATLRAEIAAYQKGMLEAAAATRAVGTEGEKLAQTRQALDQLGRAGVALGALAAAGVGLAVAKFAEFDQAMSNVLATGEDARENQAALRDAALEAGAATVFSATESANAIEELAKAGLSASDILSGGLAGSLDLAAAGGLGVAEAAGIAATTLQQFGLGGEQASHVADLLAAGAGKAMGDVTDMGEALKQAGLVANQFGLSVEETTATLAAFASSGMLGSDAGTSLRTMLLRLANPTEEVKDLMKEIGFEAYNAQGQFIGMSALAGELQSSLAGMTEEQKQATLAMIFGQDAIRGATLLYEEGASGIDDWTEKVDDAGYAAETAATRLDNLVGDWEAFTGALDTAMITMGSAADGPLRALVQGLTQLVDGFNSLPDGAQQTVLWIGVVTAAVGLLGGSFLLAVPKAAEFKTSLQTLNINRATLADGFRSFSRFLLGPWGLSMIAATAAIAAFNSAIQDGVPSQAEIANSVNKSASAVDMLRAAMSRDDGFEAALWGEYTDQIEKLPSLLDKATNANIRWWDLSFNEQGALDSIKRLGDSLSEMAETNLPAAQDAFSKLVDEFDLTDSQAEQLLREMPALRDELLKQATAAGIVADDHDLLKMALGETEVASQVAAEASAENEAALADLAGQASDTTDDVNKLADAIRGFGSAEFDVRDASRAFEEALDSLRQSVEDNGATLDITTEAGRANESALDDIAQSALDLAGSLYVTTGSQEEAAGAIQRGRDELILALSQFGITGQAAEDYADRLGLIPSDVKTLVGVSGVDAAEQALKNLVRDRFVNVKPVVLSPGQNVAPGQLGITSANGNLIDHHRFANGGGVESGVYKAGNRAVSTWLEPETIWEAYISGKPDQRERNIGIWQETGKRLGVQQSSEVSIVGAQITGTLQIGGDGLARIIDGRIVSADAASERALARGWQGR